MIRVTEITLHEKNGYEIVFNFGKCNVMFPVRSKNFTPILKNKLAQALIQSINSFSNDPIHVTEIE